MPVSRQRRKHKEHKLEMIHAPGGLASAIPDASATPSAPAATPTAAAVAAAASAGRVY